MGLVRAGDMNATPPECTIPRGMHGMHAMHACTDATWDTGTIPPKAVRQPCDEVPPSATHPAIVTLEHSHLRAQLHTDASRHCLSIDHVADHERRIRVCLSAGARHGGGRSAEGLRSVSEKKVPRKKVWNLGGRQGKRARRSDRSESQVVASAALRRPPLIFISVPC